jgi:hypothetical protein
MIQSSPFLICSLARGARKSYEDLLRENETCRLEYERRLPVIIAAKKVYHATTELAENPEDPEVQKQYLMLFALFLASVDELIKGDETQRRLKE